MVNQFKIHTNIYFNTESLQSLKHITGTRAFIVSDAIMEKLGYLQQVIQYLDEAGITSVVFRDIYPDPDVKLVANGLKLFNESESDVLIAIGGGSAIDSAKGILYFAWKIHERNGKKFDKPLFIAVPSTSGTGSEVTDFSVITSEDEKLVLINEYISPDIAILDSTCIQHVPQHVVVDTGIDALVHAIEAYVSTNATDFTDALAEKAIKLIFDNLEIIYKDINNTTARDHILNASCIAGMAFTNAGLGITHSLSHALGGKFRVPHGRANALLIHEVIQYNANVKGGLNEEVAERFAKLAALLQLPARTSREGLFNFSAAIKKLTRSLGIENNIKSLGLEQKEFENSLEQLAETALKDRCTPTNPRKPTKEDLIEIYQKCF